MCACSVCVCCSQEDTVWIMGRQRALVYWYSGSLPGRQRTSLPGSELEGGGGGGKKTNQRWADSDLGVRDKRAEWATWSEAEIWFLNWNKIKKMVKKKVREGNKRHKHTKKSTQKNLSYQEKELAWNEVKIGSGCYIWSSTTPLANVTTNPWLYTVAQQLLLFLFAAI